MGARSDFFQNATLAIVMVNAIYIGIAVEHNDANNLFDANGIFIASEFVFLLFFVFEIVVRYAAFERKASCLKDGWFKFDSFLVMLMLLETIILPTVLSLSTNAFNTPPTVVLRLFRLLRLSRIIRLVREFPELRTI